MMGTIGRSVGPPSIRRLGREIFLVLCIASAAFVGLITALLPDASRELIYVCQGVALFSISCLVLERLGLRTLRPPSLIHRQVRPSLRTRRRPLVEATWGIELGSGYSTIIPSWSWWAMLALIIGMSGSSIAVLPASVFGAVRGAQPCISRKLGACAWGQFGEWQVRYYQGGVGGSVAAVAVLLMLVLVLEGST